MGRVPTKFHENQEGYGKVTPIAWSQVKNGQSTVIIPNFFRKNKLYSKHRKKNGTKMSKIISKKENLSMSRSKSCMSEIELAYMSRMTRSYDPTITNQKVIKEEIRPLKLKDNTFKLDNGANIVRKRYVHSAPPPPLNLPRRVIDKRFYSSKTLLNQINTNMREMIIKQQKRESLSLNLLNIDNLIKKSHKVTISGDGHSKSSVLRSKSPIYSKSMTVDEWLYARSFANRRRPLGIVKHNLRMERVQDVLDLKKLGKMCPRAALNRIGQIKNDTDDLLKQLQRVHLNMNFNLIVDNLKGFLNGPQNGEGNKQIQISEPIILCYKRLTDNRTILAQTYKLIGLEGKNKSQHTSLEHRN
jgi:hypothetical protein